LAVAVQSMADQKDLRPPAQPRQRTISRAPAPPPQIGGWSSREPKVPTLQQRIQTLQHLKNLQHAVWQCENLIRVAHNPGKFRGSLWDAQKKRWDIWRPRIDEALGECQQAGLSNDTEFVQLMPRIEVLDSEWSVACEQRQAGKAPFEQDATRTTNDDAPDPGLRSVVEAAIAHDLDGLPPPPRTSPQYPRADQYPDVRRDVEAVADEFAAKHRAAEEQRQKLEAEDQKQRRANEAREKRDAGRVRARSQMRKPIRKGSRVKSVNRKVNPPVIQPKKTATLAHSKTLSVIAETKKRRKPTRRRMSLEKIAIVEQLKAQGITSKAELKAYKGKKTALAAALVERTKSFGTGEKRLAGADRLKSTCERVFGLTLRPMQVVAT
jgi:hypothetical protein